MCSGGSDTGKIVGTLAGLATGNPWLAAAGYSAGAQYDQGEQANAMQKDANKQAKDAATKQAELADQANNRANGKSPDLMGLSSQNALDAKGGVGSTMLTGPAGIDAKSLMLGRTTLLGG